MSTYYPITPVKKRNTLPFDTAARVTKHKSPSAQSTLDEYDIDDSGIGHLEDSPAQLSSPGNTENDLSVPNTPGSSNYGKLLPALFLRSEEV